MLDLLSLHTLVQTYMAHQQNIWILIFKALSSDPSKYNLSDIWCGLPTDRYLIVHPFPGQFNKSLASWIAWLMSKFITYFFMEIHDSMKRCNRIQLPHLTETKSWIPWLFYSALSKHSDMFKQLMFLWSRSIVLLSLYYKLIILIVLAYILLWKRLKNINNQCPILYQVSHSQNQKLKQYQSCWFD